MLCERRVVEKDVCALRGPPTATAHLAPGAAEMCSLFRYLSFVIFLFRFLQALSLAATTHRNVLNIYHRLLLATGNWQVLPSFSSTCFRAPASYPREKMIKLFVVLALFQYVASLSPSKGCAARPAMKQNVAVLGSGGFTGSMTFGFLQRAASIYGTGIGDCRSIGATGETAVRLNRVLGKHFCLAVADETRIKLTDLTSVDAIADRLQGWDALILGSDMGLNLRPVTGNTYEKSPNDKAWEVYWGPPKSLINKGLDAAEETRIRMGILSNTLEAAKQAGVKHIVAVDEDQDGKDSILPPLENSGVPFTCLKPRGEIIAVPDYTYRRGVQGKLSVGKEVPTGGQLSIEDLTALCVQSLQSFDWNQSRCLQVSCFGPIEDDGVSNPKRPDQEWCVNSYRLASALEGLE